MSQRYQDVQQATEDSKEVSMLLLCWYQLFTVYFVGQVGADWTTRRLAPANYVHHK